jgi:large subunit ribosomal protein L13
MKTLFARQIPSLDRKWFLVDAQGQTLGRLATAIANLLSGKTKVDYTPHLDNGDYVIVINAEKIVVSGNKEEGKIYRSHSQYLGNLKEISLGEVRQKTPERILKKAVNGMLPKNKLQDDMLERLKLVV